MPDVNSPQPSFDYLQESFIYEPTYEQQLYATFRIDGNFRVGKRVSLEAIVATLDTATANLHFKAEVFVRSVNSALTTLTRKYDSTNSAISVSISTAEKALKLLIDLTDSSGQIGGLNLQADDMITIRLYRSGSDTSSLPAFFFPRTSGIKVAP